MSTAVERSSPSQLVTVPDGVINCDVGLLSNPDALRASVGLARVETLGAPAAAQ